MWDVCKMKPTEKSWIFIWEIMTRSVTLWRNWNPSQGFVIFRNRQWTSGSGHMKYYTLLIYHSQKGFMCQLRIRMNHGRTLTLHWKKGSSNDILIEKYTAIQCNGPKMCWILNEIFIKNPPNILIRRNNPFESAEWWNLFRICQN